MAIKRGAGGGRNLMGVIAGRWYFPTFDLTAALFVAWFATWAFAAQETWETGFQFLYVALLVTLYLFKGRDEFAMHCWRRATSATFAMLIVSPAVIGFMEGFVEGITDRASQGPSEMSVDALFALLFATFFAAFEWTRFRESRV